MKYILLVTCLMLSSTLWARSFNEMLEIAIENSSEDAIKLILAQTTLTQEEKQIFLQEAQEVIDDLNNNLRLTDENNYTCGFKRITTGIIATVIGLGTLGTSEMDRFPSRKISCAGLVTFLGGCGLIAWGKKAMNDEERQEHSHHKLSKALWIKELLLQARTKN